MLKLVDCTEGVAATAHLDLRVDLGTIYVRVVLFFRARQLADQQKRVDQQARWIFSTEQSWQDAVTQTPCLNKLPPEDLVAKDEP